MRSLPAAVRLKRPYDPALLEEELELLEWRFQYVPHYSLRKNRPGIRDWGLVPLRNVGGRIDFSGTPTPSIERISDTEAMRCAPHIKQLVDDLRCTITCGRISALPPKAQIPPHSDVIINRWYGKTRLHIPVVTDPTAEMIVDSISMHWPAGELWYGDFVRIHEAITGVRRRVHLMLDAELDGSLLTLFPTYFRDAVMRHGFPQVSPICTTLRGDDLTRFVCKITTSHDCTVDVPWLTSDDGELHSDENWIMPELEGEIVVEDNDLRMISGRHEIGLDPIGEIRFRLRNGLRGGHNCV